MLASMLRIGAFSRLSGVSIKALRLYDERGLFRPSYIDPASGYRYYEAGQLCTIREIVRLREVGLSLSGIAVVIGNRSVISERLQASRADLRVSVENAREQIGRIDEMLSSDVLHLPKREIFITHALR